MEPSVVSLYQHIVAEMRLYLLQIGTTGAGTHKPASKCSLHVPLCDVIGIRNQYAMVT